MGRPKKSETGSVSTKERILESAAKLFAEKGFDAVSVRDITRNLGLNEASLYNHYKSKAHLFEKILERLNERLINPGFAPLPREFFEQNRDFDLSDFLITGAKHFFDKTDESTLLTWRMLMISQYRFETAAKSVQNHLIDAPTLFFTSIMQNLQDLGKIKKGINCKSAGRAMAAVFFDYSFRSNLKRAWDESEEDDLEELKEEIRLLSRCFEA